jgi:hypothetical protein
MIRIGSVYIIMSLVFTMMTFKVDSRAIFINVDHFLHDKQPVHAVVS